MVVVSGSSGRDVAEALAPLLGMQYIELVTRRFPDSEGYVRVPEDAIEANSLRTRDFSIKYIS